MRASPLEKPPRRSLLRYAGFCFVVLAAGTIASPAQSQCAISTTNVAFGPNVDLISGGTITTTGTISVNCPGGFGNFPYLWFCISISAGANSTSVNNRTMKSGLNTLGYQLYTDSGMNSVYQYTTPNQFSVPYNNSTGAQFTSTIYAKILSSQTSPPGPYTDPYSSSLHAQISGNVASTLPGNCSGGTGALSFSVTATVATNASISVTTLNFASVSTLPTTSFATITVQATNTTPYSIGISNGTNASGSQRRVRLGATANYLNYGLYTDVNHSNAWTTTTLAGSCTGGAGSCVLGTGTGLAQNVTVYGLVPSQTIPITGLFTDTVVVTLTF